MASQIDEIDAVLCDVRKAYRLIHLYQRRVLDVCREIIEAFESELSFYYWASSQFEMPPRRRTDPVGKWAWDFLPLYDFAVVYRPEDVDYKSPKVNDWMLEVRITADSGYVTAGEIESDPRDFQDVAGCESCVRLYVYYSSKVLKGGWLDDLLRSSIFPADDREAELANGVRTLGMKFALAEMSNAGAVRNCVDKFRQRLQEVFPARSIW
jgi:hypothetical protein